MKKLISILIIIGITVIPFLSQTYSSELPPIIDMHMHAFNKMIRTPDGTPRPVVHYPDKSIIKGTALVTRDEDILRLTLEAMKKYNIVLAVVSYKLTDVYKWKDAAPQSFLAGQSFRDPTTIDITALRKEFTDGKLDIMGEIATQYGGYPPNDPALEPIYSLAEELDVPLLIHCEGIAGPSPKFRISDGNPLLLEEVLKRHPKLRLYVENAGWPFLEEIIALMYRYPQVYVDLSTITWIIPRPTFHSYLKGLIDAGLSKRLMFGSDQMWWPETIGMAIEAIESAEFLTAEQKRDIFYNNAVRFLRLKKALVDK
jgi:predicted TIM-barrel fold metal-dependent hydrolase